MIQRSDHLRVVALAERMVPAARLGQVAARAKREREAREATEETLERSIAALGRMQTVLAAVMKNLPAATRERLRGVGIADAMEMNDVQIGGLLVHVDTIMQDVN